MPKEKDEPGPWQVLRKTAFLALVGSFSPSCWRKQGIDLRIWGARHYLPDRMCWRARFVAFASRL